MKDKNSFILYSDCREQIELLSDQEAGRLFKALFAVNAGEGLPELPPCAKMVALFITKQMERDAKKWQETCEKRREAGRKGGKATQRRLQANQANASFAKANQADNDNENENENVTDTVNDNEDVNETDTENENVRCAEPYPSYHITHNTEGLSPETQKMVEHTREFFAKLNSGQFASGGCNGG